MSDLLSTTTKKRQNLDSTFKFGPFQSIGFGVQQKVEESSPATKAQLWENYQQAKQLNQNSAKLLPIQAQLNIGQPEDKVYRKKEENATYPGSLPAGSNQLFFEYNSAILSYSDEIEIATYVQKWHNVPGPYIPDIHIDAYASEEGQEAYNYGLAAQRAQSIKDKLIGLGLPDQKVIVSPHGKTVIFSKDDLRQNRRAVLSPLPDPQTQSPVEKDRLPTASTPSIHVQNTALGGLSVGNFDFHFKDCQILIWVWVSFSFEESITLPEQITFKNRFFSSIRDKWENSGYSLAGTPDCPCANIPIKIHAEESKGSFYHKLVDVERKRKRQNVISDMNLELNITERTVAHEFGHVLGLYDEYDGGWIENKMFWHKNQPDDKNALMKSGTELRERYFEHYRDRVQQEVENDCSYRISSPVPSP